MISAVTFYDNDRDYEYIKTQWDISPVPKQSKVMSDHNHPGNIEIKVMINALTKTEAHLVNTKHCFYKTEAH